MTFSLRGSSSYFDSYTSVFSGILRYFKKSLLVGGRFGMVQLGLALPSRLPGPQQDNPDGDDVFGQDTAGSRMTPCHWELV